MNDSVLDYLITDKFIYLFLTSERFQTATRHTAVVTVYKNQFDPEMVEIFDNDDLGIPSVITCINPQYNIIDGLLENSVVGKSFTCDEITISWRTTEARDGIIWPNRLIKPASIHLNRLIKPASIHLSRYTTTHDKGVLSTFTVDSWTIRWYYNDILQRTDGPHTIEGGRIKAAADANGDVRTLHPITYTTKWNHPSDGRDISQASIKEALAYHGVTINELSKTDKVFSNPLDKMAFYATV